MKCHYEVLNVPKDADENEIKTAYRKLALKWHPDKNLDNSDFAKEQFQVVQQAYEVLSDRQERAWYDNHREQILRGADSEFKDNSLDVFQYFTTTCFKGYNDEEKGFYTVYRNVFEEIAKEDMEFMDEKEEFCEIPSFGNSQSDYESVVAPFYNYWISYSTKKSYVWLDPYNIKETRDRRVVKLIEKENKKVRQKAKKERNEEIRNLVAFVRKRDKRVQAYNKIQEARVLENRQKQEQLSKQKRLEQKKLNESGKQAEWAKFDNVKSELEEIEKHLAEQFGEEFSNSENEDEEEDLNNLYCVACNKVFKTPKAFQNHESSKKHKENIELLKETMLEEDEDFEESNVEDYDDKLSNVDSENIDELIIDETVEDNSIESDDVSVEEIKINKKKKNKRNKNILTINDDSHDENLEIDNNITANEPLDSDDFLVGSSKKQKRKSKKNTKSKQDLKPTETDVANNTEVIDDIPTKEDKSINNASKKSKKKSKKDIKEEDLNEVDIDHCCVTCKNSFQSKNKLFEHLKKTGHGVYLPSGKQNKMKSKSK